jgi:hypothetical protein
MVYQSLPLSTCDTPSCISSDASSCRVVGSWGSSASSERLSNSKRFRIFVIDSMYSEAEEFLRDWSYFFAMRNGPGEYGLNPSAASERRKEDMLLMCAIWELSVSEREYSTVLRRLLWSSNRISRRCSAVRISRRTSVVNRGAVAMVNNCFHLTAKDHKVIEFERRKEGGGEEHEGQEPDRTKRAGTSKISQLPSRRSFCLTYDQDTYPKNIAIFSARGLQLPQFFCSTPEVGGVYRGFGPLLSHRNPDHNQHCVRSGSIQLHRRRCKM